LATPTLGLPPHTHTRTPRTPTPHARPPTLSLFPAAYQQTVKQLAKALREALDAESAGAREFEVRRKADPAKDLAKQFMRRWQDDPRVAGDATHDEMKREGGG
jgi:hypothetical protein